eukprot:TRINITY_DN50508_c0_g1_i1.p1 TRINITY_DN50508_c0_g1~~TRINITY_DN50508_c0_g1_i1.p1  ORF type:complete len:112 (-),score=25.27 TRINITY_DN50508_c0_g1_i1:36-371(-)
MVELMANGEQIPDYFCSHYWGEGVLNFRRSLAQHAADRGLEEKSGWYNGEHAPHPGYLGGRSAQYWVCAYAINQHKVGEELTGGTSLKDTPFYRALQLSKGTVSVLSLIHI